MERQNGYILETGGSRKVDVDDRVTVTGKDTIHSKVSIISSQSKSKGYGEFCKANPP